MSDPNTTTQTTLPQAEEALYAEFKASTLALRDAELALMAVQQRHQKALDALRRFVAPVGPQQG